MSAQQPEEGRTKKQTSVGPKLPTIPTASIPESKKKTQDSKRTAEKKTDKADDKDKKDDKKSKHLSRRARLKSICVNLSMALKA